MAPRSTIVVGQKFGYLTIVKKLGYLEKSPKRTTWECICDCGNTKVIDSGNLRKPGLRSCGCKRKEQARLKGKKQKTEQSYFNYIYGSIKGNAKYRKLEWNLTKEEVKYIITQPCFYCDYEGHFVSTKIGIPFIVNGIDRVDNTKGYIKNNCLPCCIKCNRMKLNLHVYDFYTHIIKIMKTIAYKQL